MGNVHSRYLQYERAGDQYVGRIVAGLPLQSELFDALPPHFASPAEGVELAVRRAFPTWHEISSLQAVLRMLLASLVQHEDFLRQHLEDDHPIFNNSVFVSEDLGTLRKLLANESSSSLTATGVPAHVGIMRRLARLPEEVNKTAVAGTGFAEVQDSLTGIKTLISGLREESRGWRGVATEAGPRRGSSSPEGTQIHSWGGGLHVVPEGFNLPDVTSSTGWRLWWHGNRRAGIPPLRCLSEKDFSRDSSARRKWIDWKGAFRFFEWWCKKNGCYWQHPTEEQVEEMHQRVFRELIGSNIGFRTPTGKKRRLESLAFTTLVR
ncbi:MAG: hypothetical protein AAGJ80_12680, partial [Cyanobacteria bacterium J06553_1]